MNSDQCDSIQKLIKTTARLRAPDGCPWDREQTHRSLGRYLLEEAYEVLESIDLDDSEKLKEELGDLLLQIVLHAQLAKEAKQFDWEDVAHAINEKIVRRHPHVFGEAKAITTEEVIEQWHYLKEQEGKQASQSSLDGVPKALPALLKALKISEKAVAQGFEWSNEKEIWSQLESELAEFQFALQQVQDQKRKGEHPSLVDLNLEMGDIIFTLVNIARWHGLNPEESLSMAINKFKERFYYMEQNTSRPLKELTTGELEDLWSKAKTAAQQ